jgi:pimeloyl-ACP methyl ester carboxylesterase
MHKQYRVLALDQRSHGQAEWATDHDSARRVEDMEAFVAARGLDRFVPVGRHIE